MSDPKEVLVDVELKEMIVRSLESAGVLQNIRAQLRAATYLTLEGQQKFPDGSSPISGISQTENGALAMQLIRDFLVQTSLSNTLRVFEAETGPHVLSSVDERSSVGSALNIQPQLKTPLLLQIIAAYQGLQTDQQRPKTAGRRSRAQQPSGDSFDEDGDSPIFPLQ